MQVCGGVLVALGMWQVGSGLWIEAKAVLAQVLLERAWAASQATGAPARPWPWADTHPVARLEVPDLGIDQIVLAGANGRNLAFGPVRMEGIEATGITLLSGHRDTHFGFLRALRAGMTVSLTEAGGQKRTFQVTGSEVVAAQGARLTATGAAALALVTCWPFDAIGPDTPWRYVVSAYPVAEATPGRRPSGKSAAKNGHAKDTPTLSKNRQTAPIAFRPFVRGSEHPRRLSPMPEEPDAGRHPNAAGLFTAQQTLSP